MMPMIIWLYIDDWPGELGHTKLCKGDRHPCVSLKEKIPSDIIALKA